MTTNTALAKLTSKLATRLDMGDGTGLIETLKATAFRGQVSDAQMTALMVVANQYGLNPWTKEIYAFPDKNNGIVPVVGVDGWSRIMNEHQQFDGIEFDQDADSCTCRIYRKDRSRPIAVTEYMAECRRNNVGPWVSHPKRMLRHKAMIQCARLAFGFVGIYDQDEAENILEAKDITPPTDKPRVTMPKAKTQPETTGEVIDHDTGEIIEQKKEPTRQQAKTQQQAPQQTQQEQSQRQSAPGLASIGMLTFIRKKAAEKDIPEEVVCAEHDIETLEGITEELGNAIVTWIKAQS